MRILLSNDDGYQAPGLRVLMDIFSKEHEVIVVAPDAERSASSHCITMMRPLRVRLIEKKKNLTVYYTDGTPADSVKLALDTIFETPPDLVISGINPGPNLGIDTRYSGTVAAAFEGVMAEIPSFSVSLMSNSTPLLFSEAAEHAYKIIFEILNSDFDFNKTLVNINIPNIPEIKGIKLTRLTRNIYKDCYEKRIDPRNRDYYWLVGKLNDVDNNSDSDYETVKNGFISITPLKLDQTDHSKIESLTKIFG